MASADGKTNPFNPDGKSGATGNSGGGSQAGITNGHQGVNRPQKTGPADFNPDSIAPAGRIPKFDPPSDRDGLVTQKADDKGGMKHKPFKVGGKSSGGENTATDEAIDESTSEVGQVPTADEGD